MLPIKYGKLTSQFSRLCSKPGILPERAATRKQIAPNVFSVQRYLKWEVAGRYGRDDDARLMRGRQGC